MIKIVRKSRVKFFINKKINFYDKIMKGKCFVWKATKKPSCINEEED